MNIKWILDFISLPFLVVPTLIILVDVCITRIRAYLDKQRIIRANLKLFEMVVAYDIGAPSHEEIEKLREELQQKSKHLKKITHEQIELGHKTVIGLCPLLRQQEDIRDNEAVQKLKKELKQIIKRVKKDDLPVL
ncbi:MAG: hypothetical protein ACYCQI_14410 [Gammaproteobacteria bacterium]